MATQKYNPTLDQSGQIERAFTYHPPHGDQTDRYQEIRVHAAGLAGLFVRNCPQSRELSLAMTKLEEASFWANAAIARNELEAAK